MDPIRFLNLEYLFWLLLRLLGLTVNGEPVWSFIDAIRTISALISLLLLIGIIYCVARIRQIRKEERIYYKTKAFEAEAMRSEGFRNEKWQRVLALMESGNPNDWRLAIMECDIVLDEMMNEMGYRGETLAEKLKSVERSDFRTIDNAWDAHRMRNTIAHQGSAFNLSERDAKNTIALYEAVFKEFKYM